MKKLATVEIFLDEDAGPGESSSYTHYDTRKRDYYQIFLRPNADKAMSSAGTDTPNILAHELGHVVTHVFSTPASLASGYPTSSLQEQFAAENEAWGFSEKMSPGITKKPVYTQPMEAWKKAIKKFGPDTPIFLATNETVR